MIIWLASYPKSGNTWVRHFLASLIYSNQGKVGLEKLGFIMQYPKRDQFEKLVTNLDDFNQIKKNWINSQNLINSDNKLSIFKTHHVLCSLGKDNFTDEKNTLGAIYIVRDPRNIISSILYHFNLSNTEEALNFIQREDTFIGNVKNKVNYPLHTLIGSWKTNYNSWKFFGKNFLLVKYENLILNPNTEFKRIANYITNTTNIKFSEKQIKKSIDESSFENLQKLEDENGFIESIINPENKKRKKFFNLGPRNNWKKSLDKKFVDEIENSFKNEMKELGYI
ncbi:sulfotransferase domain-containing protein [Candidatus Pelagibacter sp.]|nr:sulfotransferase domain-containing protein [Candidatus Pelagibacter sp.]